MKNLDRFPAREPTREATPELATEPTKHKKSKLNLQQKLMNEIMAGAKNINDGVFGNYFKYHYPSFLAKDLTGGN